MRHRKSGLKLNRTSSHRNAMFRNMVTSLFKHERISTTDTKAKELKRWADNMITLAKRGDLHARRQALAVICEKEVVHKLFDEAPKRFASVSGGYTRVTKIGLRAGDAAKMSIIELVNPNPAEAKKISKKEAPAKVETEEKETKAVETKESPEAVEAPEKVEEEKKE